MLIEMFVAYYMNMQMYETLYIDKIEFKDDDTLNVLFKKYNKNEHILILELIDGDVCNFLIQLNDNYKCSECFKKITNLNDKYNCDFCHFSLFCDKRCSQKSNDHTSLDKQLKNIMETNFNLSDFLNIKFKNILIQGTIKGKAGMVNKSNSTIME